MAINGLNVGRDATIVLYDSNRKAIIATANITDFDEKADMTEIKSRPLSGKPIYGYIPEGWQGSFTADRTNRVFDDLFFNLENLYYSGGNVLSMTISKYVNEPDGTVSEYQHLGVAIRPTDLGTWKGDAKVTQKFDWKSSERKKIQ